MFERRVCHFDNQLVGRKSVRLDDDRLSFALGQVQHGTQLFQRDLLIPEINRRRRAARDADDSLIDLRAERKARERHRNGNARLQNKMRAEQEKKEEQKDYVKEWNHHEPAEVIFLRPAELHACADLTTNEHK